MDKKSLLILGVMLITVLVAGFFVLNSYIYNEKQSVTVVEPYRATLTGEQVCLPTRDPSKPITKECAIGIKTDTGEYFALDFNLMSQETPQLQSGLRFSANGLVTPIENLSTDYWQKYNVESIFSVTDSLEIEEVELVVTPEPPATTTEITIPATTTISLPPTKECFVGGCSSQLCTSDPDIVSDCMYREEYACYQEATCEVQTTGECGWTMTEELNECLVAF